MRRLFLFCLCLLLAPAGQAQEPLVAKAHMLHKKLQGEGRIQSPVQFATSSQSEHKDSVAVAIADYTLSSCMVLMSPQGLLERAGSHHVLWRFVLYHEMAHCDLFYRNKIGQFYAKLSPEGNALLADLIAVEFLLPGGVRPVNRYNQFHETYADIKAYAMLLQEDLDPMEKQMLANFRGGGLHHLFSGHPGSDLWRKTVALDWSGKSAQELEDQAIALAGRHMIETHMREELYPAGLPMRVSELLLGAIQSICSSYHSPWADRDDLRLLEERLRQARWSPSLLWRDIATQVFQDSDCSTVADNMLRRHHPQSAQRDNGVDREIMAWFTQLAGKPGAAATSAVAPNLR